MEQLLPRRTLENAQLSAIWNTSGEFQKKAENQNIVGLCHSWSRIIADNGSFENVEISLWQLNEFEDLSDFE
jgi:hypothetical protein